MRPELITALEAISEGVILLRAGPSTVLRVGNPNHKGSGPGGGQFTSTGGSGSSHGKSYAKRQRRRKRKLEQLRQKGHAKIAELKAKHAKERKALRSKHRKEGASYSDRSSQSKALRATHKAEARQTIDAIKKEAREAFPKSTGKSSKAKEYREKEKQRLSLIEAVVKEVDVVVPEALIEGELDRMMQGLFQAARQGWHHSFSIVHCRGC